LRSNAAPSMDASGVRSQQVAGEMPNKNIQKNSKKFKKIVEKL
jgi:hypothetical protein